MLAVNFRTIYADELPFHNVPICLCFFAPLTLSEQTVFKTLIVLCC